MEFLPEDVATAYHEAGHAVIALALGRSVHRVSIQPNQSRLGQCELKKGSSGRARDALETELLILLGGMAAQARHTGNYDTDGARRDLRQLREFAAHRAGSERQVERFERRLLDKAEHLLDQPGIWPAIERIAAELLKSKLVSGRAAAHHFREAVAAAER